VPNQPNSISRILVAIATYKRKAPLEKLLSSLEKLKLSTLSANEVTILIVDNDPDQSAQTVHDTYSETSIYKVQYQWEKRPGVTHVRNTALEIGLKKGFEFVAFIDDDEVAHANWLEELLKQQKQDSADAVFGNVISQYENDTPGWISASKPHGIELSKPGPTDTPAGVGNSLISLEAIKRTGLIFSEEMSLTGGEDTLFFYEMHDAGCTLSNAPNAVVDEDVPLNRSSLGWLWKRWYRTGITDSIIINRHKSNSSRRIKALTDGLIRTSIGSVLLGISWVTRLGKTDATIGKRVFTVARGVGMLSYAFGGTYEEYGSKKAD